MRPVLLPALLAGLAGAAAAQPVNERPPTWTIQCIDVSGNTAPASCTVPASRVDQSELICTCPAGGLRTRVPICAAGQRPPPESAALNRTRKAAARDGSLEGDTFEGRPICVAPRNP